MLLSAIMDNIPRKYLAALGRKGGKARLTTMTDEERKASASKAGQVSALKRKAEAAARRKAQGRKKKEQK